MNTSEIFLIAMMIIFAVPYLIWRLGKTEYYAPLVVVQIITGILLGPGLLGALYPHYYAFVFNSAVVQSLNGVAWWAVMSFVWIAGAGVWEHRIESGIAAGLALGTPLLLGCAAAIGLPGFSGWIGPEPDRWYVGLIWLVLCSLGADWSGLHFMVGAFLSGAIMDSHWFDQKQMDTLRQNVLLIMM